MPVPGVSHENWERVRGLSQIAMATTDIPSTELPFEEQVWTILDNPDGGQTYDAEIENMKGEEDDYYHTKFEKGITVPILPNEEDTMHRPEVSEELESSLTSRVNREYPNVRVEQLGFDKKLKLLCDRAEEYFELLDCEIRETDRETLKGAVTAISEDTEASTDLS